MRRAAVLMLSSLLVACQPASPDVDDAEAPAGAPEPSAAAVSWTLT